MLFLVARSESSPGQRVFGIRSGKLYVWGAGVLGNGKEPTWLSSPVQIGSATNWTTITVGGGQIFGIVNY